MSRFRRLLMGGALAALVITALGAPVAAADTQGTLAFVNGVPGVRIDVCVNGNEIKSGLRYGQAFLRDVIGTGEKVLKFYRRDPRECRGQLHAKVDGLIVAAGTDLTIVVTKNAPKVAIFSNAGFGEIPPAGTPLAFGIVVFRHAADFLASMKLRYWTPAIGETPITPSADPVWTHEDQLVTTSGVDWIWQARATRPDDPDTVAIHRATVKASHRYEWILIGSNPGNARFVFLDRIVSNTTP